MATRFRFTVWGAVAAAALLSIWLLSTEPFGMGIFQLLVFTAPGALLGLGAGWMAHATRRSAWNWESGRRAALLGAATLPPILAFLIAVDGSARPQQLLVGFVHVAWVALAGGGIIAAFRWPKLRSRARRLHGRPGAGWSARSRTRADRRGDFVYHSTSSDDPRPPL